MTYQRINSGKKPVKKKEIMLNNSPIISILCNRSDLNGREVIKCSNPTAVEEYFNVSSQHYVDTYCQCCVNVGVENTSDIPILVDNPNITVVRVCG